jgi:hypothetical protein
LSTGTDRNIFITTSDITLLDEEEGGIALPEVGRGGGGGDRPDDDDTRPEPCALGKVEGLCALGIAAELEALCTGLSGGNNARRVAGGAATSEDGLLNVILRRTSTRVCLAPDTGAEASIGRFNNDDDDEDEADEVGLATTTAVGEFDEVGSEDDATTTTGGDAG